jgi:O-antigen ligase
MRKAAWALLLLFTFAIPWEYSLDLGPPLGNIARLLGLLTAVAAFPAVFRGGRLHRPGPLHWVTLALYLWLCCSFFWTIAPRETAVKLRGYPQEMMLVWLVCEFAENPADLRSLLRAWLAGSWVLALLTIASFASTDVTLADQIRFAAIGQDPNDTARFLDFGFPLAALLLDGREHWTGRLLAIAYFPAGLAAVLLTASRGGFLVALAALAGCALLAARRVPKALLLGAIAFPALAAVAWAAVPAGTIERLGTIAEQLQNGDLNQRVSIWRQGWQAFLQAPFCGHGAGSFVTAARLAPIDTAHNTALAILVEGGLCGFAIASLIVIISLHSILQTRGAIRLALGTLMAVWLLSSLVGTVGENRTTWHLLGLIAVSRRLSQEEPDTMLASFSAYPSDPALERNPALAAAGSHR